MWPFKRRQKTAVVPDPLPQIVEALGRVETSRELFRIAVAHSADYCVACGYVPSGNLFDEGMTVNAGNYTLRIQHTCGAPYGGEWHDLWIAEGPGAVYTGGGTTGISVLTEAHHLTLMDALRKMREEGS